MAKISRIISPDGYVTERLAVHKNQLLGDYDQGGEYRISSKIVKELMQMRKVKKHTYNNSMFCVSDNLGIGELLFEIHYEKKAVGKKAFSEIFVLEDVYKVNGYFVNTIRTKIGEFVSTVDNYIEKSYDYYNITLADEEEGRDKLDNVGADYPYIMAKQEYERVMLRTIAKDMEDAYKKFFDTKMSIANGEKGEYFVNVVAGYESEYNLIKDRFLTANGDNNYVAYNELLDKVIEDRDGVVKAEAEDSKRFYSALEAHIETLSKTYVDATLDADKEIRKAMNKEDLARAMELKDEVLDRNRFVRKSPIWDSGMIFDIRSYIQHESDTEATMEPKKDKSKSLSDISNKMKNIAQKSAKAASTKRYEHGMDR